MEYIVKNKKIGIRLLSMKDKEALYQMSQENSMAKWLPDQVYESLEETQGVVKFLISQYQSPVQLKEGPLVFGVELLNTQQLIGHVGLSPFENGYEIGYAIGEAYQKNGYGTQAVTLFSNWALENKVLETIVAVVNHKNMGSIHLLKNSGFKKYDEKYRTLYDQNSLYLEFKKELQK